MGGLGTFARWVRGHVVVDRLRDRAPESYTIATAEWADQCRPLSSPVVAEMEARISGVECDDGVWKHSRRGMM